MSTNVRWFEGIDRSQAAAVGGKGANLGELARIDGVQVPAGFCVTTDVYRQVVGSETEVAEAIDRLAAADPGDLGAVRVRCEEVRRIIEGITVPDDLATEIARERDEWHNEIRRLRSDL